MSRRARRTRGLLYVALAFAYLLHNDFWSWHDSRLWLGLPVGFSYHIAYCLMTAVLMGLLVTIGWPDRLETADQPGERR